MIKKILLGLTALVVLVLLVGGGFVFSKTSAFDEGAAKVYDVKPADISAPDLSSVAFDSYKPDADPPPASGDEGSGAEAAAGEQAEGAALAAAARDEKKRLRAIWERGEHLANSLGACTICHGADLATPDPSLDMGPVGHLVPPNISMGGVLKDYTDGEIHRLLTHGIKKDGTSVRFMDSTELGWWPDEDYVALIGFLRTVPPTDKTLPPTTIGTLGKVLDQLDKLPILVAARIDHSAARDVAPEPAETVAYGAFVGKLCIGCHGHTLSGGPIPGAPPELPVPKNITMHETGIAKYNFEQFETILRSGVKPDGTKLDPFMPVAATSKLSDTEMKALWAFLQSAPKLPFGNR